MIVSVVTLEHYIFLAIGIMQLEKERTRIKLIV